VVDNLQPLSVAMLFSIPLKLSNNSNNKNLDPNFVTGFSDAEGCFLVKLEKYSQYAKAIEFNFVLQ
jgi:hypothetical protein